MKKFLITISFAVFIGTLCGIFLFMDSNNKVKAMINTEDEYTFFQLGVFTSDVNAKEFQKKYKGSVIENDDEYYRVSFAILKNEKNIEKMEDYLKTNNINYYLKRKKVVSSKFISKASDYEKVIASTKDEDVFIKTIKKINNLYKKEIIKNED